jgi:hypothetical protein
MLKPNQATTCKNPKQFNSINQSTKRQADEFSDNTDFDR